MTNTLTFTKNAAGEYVATFVSTGAAVIELERSRQSPVAVRANLSGMAAVPVASFQSPYGPNIIFDLDIPSGIEVTIISRAEVTAAKIMDNA